MLIDHSDFKSVKITNAQNVFDILISVRKVLHQFDLDKEFFYCIGLSRNNNIRYIDLVSMGSMTGTLAEPRELFRNAIHYGVAGGIIIAHNHPSGNLDPSNEDRIITKRIKEAGKIIGIQLVDHVIFTTDDFYSFANEGNL